MNEVPLYPPPAFAGLEDHHRALGIGLHVLQGHKGGRFFYEPVSPLECTASPDVKQLP